MTKPQWRTRIATMALGMALTVGLAACGGSTKATSTKSTSTKPSTGTGGGAAPKFHAVLTGQNHAPVATKPWHYTVRVSSPTGQPMAGTVETEFAFAGQVVGRESPPTHRLKRGTLTDAVEFPQQAVGQPLELQVVVHTSAGSQTLDWPVSVKP